MEIAGISVNYLGAAALPVGIMWLWIMAQRKDIKAMAITIKDERDYGRLLQEKNQAINVLYQELAIKNTEVMAKLETAWQMVLREGPA